MVGRKRKGSALADALLSVGTDARERSVIVNGIVNAISWLEIQSRFGRYYLGAMAPAFRVAIG